MNLYWIHKEFVRNRMKLLNTDQARNIPIISHHSWVCGWGYDHLHARLRRAAALLCWCWSHSAAIKARDLFRQSEGIPSNIHAVGKAQALLGFRSLDPLSGYIHQAKIWPTCTYLPTYLPLALRDTSRDVYKYTSHCEMYIYFTWFIYWALRP